jgi:hypothetical protein
MNFILSCFKTETAKSEKETQKKIGLNILSKNDVSTYPHAVEIYFE